jgi:hypothetical protein
MKILLTFFLSVVLFSTYGQVCTIDYAQTQVGIYPDTLPTGFVGQPYSADVTFVMPLDTMGYDFTNFHILSVSLPVGLSWQCNNNTSNCDYNPQVSQYGCVNIAGTPLLAGVYSVYVTVLADLTVVQGYPFQFQIYMEVQPSNVTSSNDGFTMTGGSGCSPITVDFTNNNPGLLAYSWDFGNGNTSSLENPAPQVYNAPGDYVVHYEAFANLDTIDVYTLTGITVTNMNGYGEGFPSYEDPDVFVKVLENGTSIYNSSIVGNATLPVSFPTNIVMDPANAYVIQVYEADESFGDFVLGADDFMGNHTVMLTGCTGCAVSGGDSGSGASINYSVLNQTIHPTPSVISNDTVHVYGYPALPDISYDSLSHTLSTTDQGYGYQWYFNGSPITAASNPDYLVTMSGDYYVVAINQTGCVSFSDTISAVYCNPSVEPTVTSNASGELVANGVPSAYTIQWLLDGTPLPGENANTIPVTASGAYAVEIADTFGCVYTSQALNVGLGLTNVSTSVWSISPVPADDHVIIRVEEKMQIQTIALIDLSGRVIREWDWQKCDQMTLDTSDIPAGCFVIQLNDGRSNWSRKLIIE